MTPDTAFAHHLESHRGAIAAYILKLSRSVDMAEDCAAEAICRGWATRERMRGDLGALRSYLKTIARNHYIALCELQINRRTTARVDDLPERGVGPEQETLLLLKEALAGVGKLAPHYRDALVQVMDGMTQREAAAEAGCPLGTMAARVKRAHEKMAAWA